MKLVQLRIAGLALCVLAGCGQSTDSKPSTTEAKPAAPEATAPSAAGTQYIATEEPAGVLEIGEARKSAKADETVAIVGRIGGSEEPFVEGLAAFTLVDLKVEYCGDDEGCPSPWDYCCNQNEVKENIATIKLVDADGKPVAEDARKLLGVKELSVIVAQGTAKRDESGNLTVAASRIFVRPVK